MTAKKLIKFYLLIITTTLLTTLFLTSSSPSRAQTSSGVSAIPPRLEITINPGQVKTAQIKVRNESSTTKTLTTIVKDFVVIDNSGTPIQIEETDISPDENRWAASSWIQLSPTTTSIKAKETKSITVTILAPPNALPGGHYAMILHRPDTDAALNSSGTAVQTQVGTLIYITIPGKINQNAQVKKFTAPKFSEFGPIDFTTIITNLSDIHISPIGSITVKNWLNSTLTTLPLEEINIFPYTSRTFLNTLNKKWLFGRYQAQLTAGYGTSGQALAATIFFWVIPWRLILLSLSAIAIIIILIKLYKKRKQLKS